MQIYKTAIMIFHGKNLLQQRGSEKEFFLDYGISCDYNLELETKSVALSSDFQKVAHAFLAL